MKYVITTTKDSSRTGSEAPWFGEAFNEGPDDDLTPSHTSGFQPTAEAAETELRQQILAEDPAAEFVDDFYWQGDEPGQGSAGQWR